MAVGRQPMLDTSKNPYAIIIEYDTLCRL